jgi:sugar/nucleoside kinase (ribokinase family)
VTSRVRLLAVGDNVVDCYPDLGVMFPGGNAVNVAVNAVRCNARAGYVGALGTDRAGRLLHRALGEEGVDLDLVRVVDGPNARAVVRIVDGNRVFESGELGVSRFRVSDPDLAAAAAADIVHTGECSMTEPDLPRLARAARLLSFDFSERPWDYITEHAGLVGIAILSLPEGRRDDAVNLARRVRGLGPERVVVSRGAQGALLLGPGGLTEAHAGTGPVVDTLGAGDALIARLLVGLAGGEPDDVALRAATSYATSTCAEYGAFGYQTTLDADEDPSPVRA